MCDLDETHQAEPPANQSHFSTTPKIEDGGGKKSSIDRPADGWMDLQLVSFSAGQVRSRPSFPSPSGRLFSRRRGNGAWSVARPFGQDDTKRR